MTVKTTLVATGITVGVVVALLVASSGSSERERLSADMVALQEQLARLESGQADLIARLEQRDRRRTSAPRPRATARETGSESSQPPRATPSSASASADEPGFAAAPSDAAGEALREFTDSLSAVLASESGEKLIGAAIAGHQYRQETERRQRMATAAIAVFAEKAGLAEAPTKELTAIILDSASEIRSVWASMRSGTGGPDMGRRVQENIARTRELRDAANEKARMVLSPDQFATFEDEAEELHDLVSGPRTRRSGNRGEDAPRSER